MAQPNVTGLKAAKRKKNRNYLPLVQERVYTCTNLPNITCHYNKLKPLQLDKPIPNLKTIPLSKTPISDVVTVLSPTKRKLVNLVDGRSSHIPSIAKVSNTNPLKNPSALIAANTAINFNTPANTLQRSFGKMAKKSKAKRLAAMLAAQNVKQAARQVSAQAFMPGAALVTTPGAAQATTPGASTATTTGAAKATTTGAAKATTTGAAKATTMGAAKATTMGAAKATTMGAAKATTMGAAKATTMGAAKATTMGAAKATTMGAAKATTTGAARATTTGAAPIAGQVRTQATAQHFGNATRSTPNVTGNPSNPPPNTYQKTSGITKALLTSFTKQQKKKWLKTKKKLNQQNKLNAKWMTPVINEEPALPETSQDGSPNVSAAASTVSMGVSNQGPTVPIIQKPSITLNTKKNLQQEMAPQRLACIKPDASPRTSPLIGETPPSAGLILGSTIPILENRTVEPTPRSNAGSFFKKAAPPQPSPTPRPPDEPYGNWFSTAWRKEDSASYKYPKGIPRSFILQQEKALEASGSPITADSPISPSNPSMNAYQMNAATSVQAPPPPVSMAGNNITRTTSPVFVQTENPVDVEQPYSPSDVYAEQGTNPELPEVDSESSEQNQAGQKRLSAFQRLGPVSQPKKPKLTINLNLKKEQPVREVVNESDDDPDKYTPVHLRKDIMLSTDETVVKFLPSWPWRKNILVRRSATARTSRSVMILEQEKMEEAYEKDNIYIQISVKGYPSTWTKERVLDAVLDSVKGYSLIPCFTEFYQHECKFLVMRSRSALVVLHKTGFYIHKDGVELAITISLPVLPDPLHFIPRIILRKRVVMGYMDNKLNLSAFTLQDDISHFIYFPLNRLSNQSDCHLTQSTIEWDRLVELDLSHNRLTKISGFDLVNVTPRLKHLDLSHNCLEKINILLNDRQLPLKTIRLEGNPLCHDYIEPEHYVKVIKMMFPAVVEIDGIPIPRKGELPNHKQNYCPEEAQEVAEKFLEIFYPLLDSGPDHRSLIQGMYEDDATLTITYCYKLRYGQIYRSFRNLFLYARFLDEGETDSVVGAMAITKLINRWPHTEHDPFTFTVDVLYHTENTTILRISGVLKLTAETLAEDEHLLSFTRTVVLYSEDGTEYKIQNEMVYWHEPSAAAARSAFRVNTISQKNFNLKIESTTDEDLRDKFLKIFMKLTTMDKKICERCLEINKWNFKLALEHFTKLLKLNNLDSLTQEVQAAS